jgi:biopolymer transport protein ExbD
MKFRRRTPPGFIGFQIAPMVDVLIVLLCFFIVTWNFSRKENALDVKVPAAKNSKEPVATVNQTVLNVKKDGTVEWNRKTVPLDELHDRLQELARLYPDYAIILRGDENASYRAIMNVLDTCRGVGIWNVAFATDKVQ